MENFSHRQKGGGIPRLRFLMDEMEKFWLSDKYKTCDIETCLKMIDRCKEAQRILNE